MEQVSSQSSERKLRCSALSRPSLWEARTADLGGARLFSAPTPHVPRALAAPSPIVVLDSSYDHRQGKVQSKEQPALGQVAQVSAPCSLTWSGSVSEQRLIQLTHWVALAELLSGLHIPLLMR